MPSGWSGQRLYQSVLHRDHHRWQLRLPGCLAAGGPRDGNAAHPRGSRPHHAPTTTGWSRRMSAAPGAPVPGRRKRAPERQSLAAMVAGWSEGPQGRKSQNLSSMFGNVIRPKEWRRAPTIAPTTATGFAREVHHVLALADVGESVESNLRSCCKPCHGVRTNLWRSAPAGWDTLPSPKGVRRRGGSCPRKKFRAQDGSER
jgi:5-methylcytosine-specific restriction endonuclease McrA